MAEGRRMPGWTIVVVALLMVVLARGAFTIARDRNDGLSNGAGGPNSTIEERVSTYSDPTVVGRIRPDEITEASGLVASRAMPDVLWTHNDSGGTPVVYCLRTSGEGCGTVTLSGVVAQDWEDIALGPGTGGWDLYIADIGDNDRVRNEVQIHRIPEPDPVPVDSTTDADTMVLSYPDRPHDAETLLIHPDSGDLYIITKEFSSRSLVFVAPAPLRAEMTLERVGTITINDFLSDRTGGDISPDGARVILSTYASGYELLLPDGEPFDEIWEQELHKVDIGEHQQGEAVTYSSDGSSVFATSEGRNPPLYRIDRRQSG